MIRIKICGVRSIADAAMAADAGADAIGLNFYRPSPRYLDPREALVLMREFPLFTAAVGVTVDMPLRQACALGFQLGLHALQTYPEGAPGEDSFPFAHIAAFRVSSPQALAAITEYVASARSLGCAPAAVLVDAHVPGQMGGTGQQIPWEWLEGVDFGAPLILAGGLSPDNVAEAVRRVQPWGVDVASGVESSPGQKDPTKVQAFIEHARAAAM